MSCVKTVQCTRGHYSPPAHWHPTDQLLLILEGHVEIKISEHCYVVDEPSIVFINHLENHIFYNSSSNYYRYVIDIIPSEAGVQLADCDRLLSPFMNRPEGGSHVFPVYQIASELQMLFHMLYSEKEFDDSEASQVSLLQTILQFLYRNLPQAFHFIPHPLTRIIRQVQQRFDNDPCDDSTLAQLAEEFHLSVSHLTHTFKLTTGYSIGQYRLLCRISHAKQLLNNTDTPISEVCSQCGFADPSNFSRYFREEVGCSPSAYRKQRTRISD